MKWLAQISHDDAFMKLLFDHVRNWVIAGTLLAAAAGAAAAPHSALSAAIVYPGAAVLALLGVFMLVVNSAHLDHKLGLAGMSPPARFLLLVTVGSSLGLVLSTLVIGQLAR
jgi:hypothetical protein